MCYKNLGVKEWSERRETSTAASFMDVKQIEEVQVKMGARVLGE